MAEAKYTPRLKGDYLERIVPAMTEKFGYKNRLEVPRLDKIVLNMGVGEATQDKKKVETAAAEMELIAGQKPVVTKAKKSIAQFKLREGMPVGVMVTLRSERMWEMFDRLTSIAIPRIRDFRGLNPRSFDGRGNYTLGLREQIIFPEVDYDAIDQVRGLNVTITTSAQSDDEARELLRMLGMPFRSDEGGPSAAEMRRQQEEAEAKRAAEQQAAEQLKAERGEEEPEAPAEEGSEETSQDSSGDGPAAEQSTESE